MMSDDQKKAGLRTIVIGTVVSSKKMMSTIVVKIKRKVKHPLYGKYVNRFSKMYAHDAEGKASIGDTVEIQMSKPISKNKNWVLVRVVDHSAQDNFNVV